MDRPYYRYCRITAVAFVLITGYTVPSKLLDGRLAEDWLHSGLHLVSGVGGAYAGWVAPGVLPARAFTWGVGLLYVALGLYGWFTPGLLLDTPLVIPLGVADNVFHLLLSMPALVILARDARRVRPARKASGE